MHVLPYRSILAGVALLAGASAPAIAADGEPPGPVGAPNAPVTFCRDVAPIMYSNCMTCHRPGEVGPFPLTSYAEVRKKARTIIKAVDLGRMPPWRADSHGEFANERK